MKDVFKVKVFKPEYKTGKMQEDTESSYPKGTTRTKATDDAVSSFAHFSIIKIRLYGKSGKLLSSKIRHPRKLFGV